MERLIQSAKELIQAAIFLFALVFVAAVAWKAAGLAVDAIRLLIER